MKRRVLAVTMAAATACSALMGSAAFADGLPVHEAAYEGTAASATVKHDTISIAMDVEPGNLSPEVPADSGGSMWKWEVYEHLFEINGLGGDLVGVIAKSYEMIDDTTYRVYLYEGVTDSDGNEITASDVAYSYDVLLNAGNRMSGDIAKFDHGEVVDDYTVDMIMREPLTGLSDLSAIFGQPYVYAEKAAEDHNLAVDPCGTGPYVVTDYQSGSSITLEAKDDYWAEGTDHQSIRQCANVQTIVYKVVAEASQNAVGLQTGELDFTSYVSSTDIAQFQEGGAYSENYYTIDYLDNLTTALFPNASDSSLCADENLRAAIFYALDGAQLAMASGSAGYVVSSTLGNAKFAGYQEAWESEDNYYHTWDMEKAAEYLAQSSYDGSTLNIVMNSEVMLTNVATAIQALLVNIGINTEITAVDGTIAEDMQVNGEYDLYLTKMASDDYLPIVWLRWFSEDYHSVSHTINNSDDPMIQELLSACVYVDTYSDETVDAFHQYMIEHFYGYGLFSQTKSDVLTNDITEPCWNFQDYIIPGGCIYADNEF